VLVRHVPSTSRYRHGFAFAAWVDAGTKRVSNTSPRRCTIDIRNCGPSRIAHRRDPLPTDVSPRATSIEAEDRRGRRRRGNLSVAPRARQGARRACDVGVPEHVSGVMARLSRVVHCRCVRGSRGEDESRDASYIDLVGADASCQFVRRHRRARRVLRLYLHACGSPSPSSSVGFHRNNPTELAATCQ